MSRNDPNTVLCAVRQNPEKITLSTPLLHHVFLIEAVKLNPAIVLYLPFHLRKDERLMMSLLDANMDCFKYLLPKYQRLESARLLMATRHASHIETLTLSGDELIVLARRHPPHTMIKYILLHLHDEGFARKLAKISPEYWPHLPRHLQRMNVLFGVPSLRFADISFRHR